MPIDTRKDPHLVAAVFADIVGSKAIADREAFHSGLRGAAAELTRLFRPGLIEPFAVANGDELQGALGDPAQAPLCVSVMREVLLPMRARVFVAIGSLQVSVAGSIPRDPYAAAAEGLTALKRRGALTGYSGTGPAADILLNAICRLTDPLLEARTDKQWEAIAAYRRLGHQRAVADRLGVTRQSVGDRLAAGHWRAVQEADAALAAFLSYVRAA